VSGLRNWRHRAPVPARRCAAGILIAFIAAARVAMRLPIRHLPGQQPLCRLLVRLAEAANPLVQLDSAASEQIVRMIVQSRIALAVVLGSTPAGITAIDVYPLAADQMLGEPAVQWLLHHGSGDGALTAAVHRALVAPASSGDALLYAALLLIPVVAASLSREQATTVWEFCLKHSAEPTDPYNPILLTEFARQGAVELLAERSELDLDIGSALPPYVGPTLAVAAELLASGLRRRAPDGGRALTAVLGSWSPSSAGALAFARATDGTVAQVAAPEAKRSWAALAGQQLYRLARNITALLAGPAVSGVVVWYTHLHHWRASAVTPGIAEAIAALTVVATVNIFTVQLSAQRLPGAIARVAGRPALIVASYSLTVTMVILSVFSDEIRLGAAAAGWARIILLVIFLFTFVGAMYVIVRRTDPQHGAEAFAAGTSAAHRAAGRRLGRAQAKAVSTRALLSDLIGFEQGIEPELVGVRTRIFATHRGLLLPSPRRLRRIAAISSVADGSVRIRISPGIGTTVSRGEQIAAILPASSTIVPKRLPRRVDAALRVRGMRRLDDVGTSAVALVAMAVELAGSGDVGSAYAVAEVAAERVSEHVVATRAARRRQLARAARHAVRVERRHPPHTLRTNVESASAAVRARDNKPAPAIPALRDTVKATVRARLTDERQLADVTEKILGALLRHSELADSAAAMAVLAVPDDWERVRAHPSAVVEILIMSGVRALELRDRGTIALVRDRLQHLSDGHLEWTVDGASVLTALTCWLAPDTADEMFDWYVKLAAGVRATSGLYLCRIGGAALLAGVPSIAVRAAQAILQMSSDLHVLRGIILGDLIRTREVAQSDMRGGYLGRSPADALADFLTLAERLRPVLSDS
jgi:hypothetical protein